MGKILQSLGLRDEHTTNLLKILDNMGEIEYDFFENQFFENQERFRKLLELEKTTDDKINDLEVFVDEIISEFEIQPFLHNDYMLSCKIFERYLKEGVPIGSYLDDGALASLQRMSFNEIESEKLDEVVCKLEEKSVTTGILSNGFQMIKLKEFMELEKDVNKNLEDKEMLKEVLKNYE